MARARLWFEHPRFVVLVHGSGNVEAIRLGNAEHRALPSSVTWGYTPPTVTHSWVTEMAIILSLVSDFSASAF